MAMIWFDKIYKMLRQDLIWHRVALCVEVFPGSGEVSQWSALPTTLPLMHAIAPTHPGWHGTPRPDWLASVQDLAQVYLDFLEDQQLNDVLVIGSSLGGWLEAEMVVRDRVGRVSGLSLIDAVGIEVVGQPIRDFFALDARGVAEYAWHDVARFYVDPATVLPERAALQATNTATLRVVAGSPYMHDPTLLRCLHDVRVSTLDLWGDSDRTVTPAYGEAYADALPDAHFVGVAQAGHLPQIEQPQTTCAFIDTFLQG